MTLAESETLLVKYIQAVYNRCKRVVELLRRMAQGRLYDRAPATGHARKLAYLASLLHNCMQRPKGILADSPARVDNQLSAQADPSLCLQPHFPAIAMPSDHFSLDQIDFPADWARAPYGDAPWPSTTTWPLSFDMTFSELPSASLDASTFAIEGNLYSEGLAQNSDFPWAAFT